MAPSSPRVASRLKKVALPPANVGTDPSTKDYTFLFARAFLHKPMLGRVCADQPQREMKGTQPPGCLKPQLTLFTFRVGSKPPIDCAGLSQARGSRLAGQSHMHLLLVSSIQERAWRGFLSFGTKRYCTCLWEPAERVPVHIWSLLKIGVSQNVWLAFGVPFHTNRGAHFIILSASL